MTLKTRINQLATMLAETDCPVCNRHLPAVTEIKVKVESYLHNLIKLGLSRKEAIVQLQEVAPMIMRRVGLLPVIPEGHCAGCGASLRSPQEAVQDLFEKFKVIFNGDEVAARDDLTKCAPGLVAWLN